VSETRRASSEPSAIAPSARASAAASAAAASSAAAAADAAAASAADRPPARPPCRASDSAASAAPIESALRSRDFASSRSSFGSSGTTSTIFDACGSVEWREGQRGVRAGAGGGWGRRRAQPQVRCSDLARFDGGPAAPFPPRSSPPRGGETRAAPRATAARRREGDALEGRRCVRDGDGARRRHATGRSVARHLSGRLVDVSHRLLARLLGHR